MLPIWSINILRATGQGEKVFPEKENNQKDVKRSHSAKIENNEKTEWKFKRPSRMQRRWFIIKSRLVTYLSGTWIEYLYPIINLPFVFICYILSGIEYLFEYLEFLLRNNRIRALYICSELSHESEVKARKKILKAANATSSKMSEMPKNIALALRPRIIKEAVSKVLLFISVMSDRAMQNLTISALRQSGSTFVSLVLYDLGNALEIIGKKARQLSMDLNDDDEELLLPKILGINELKSINNNLSDSIRLEKVANTSQSSKHFHQKVKSDEEDRLKEYKGTITKFVVRNRNTVTIFTLLALCLLMCIILGCFFPDNWISLEIQKIPKKFWFLLLQEMIKIKYQLIFKAWQGLKSWTWLYICLRAIAFYRGLPTGDEKFMNQEETGEEGGISPYNVGIVNEMPQRIMIDSKRSWHASKETMYQ